MTSDRDESFTAFVTAQAPALRRLAYAVCGDWHRADDLVQAALEKAYVHWGRVTSADDPVAYVRTILLRSAISESRRPWRRREHTSEQVPETSADDASGSVGDRLDLAAAVRMLTPKQRAIVVLRYVEDRSVAEVAQLLSIAEGTVKRQSHDAVARLRAELSLHEPTAAQGVHHA